MEKMIRNHWQIILLFILSFLITWPIFMPGYFTHHDDLQVMRIYEMRKCLEDLQIPCRWVPDMGYGFGFPLYNFYGPFPYYIGAILSYVFGYIGAAKILFLIPFILGGLSMYLLAKEIFGKYPGFVAGILYLFAPYRALDSYVRGAVAESFAIAIAPLLFYFIYKLIKEKKLKDLVLFAVSFAIFLTCHNIMTIMFTPVLLLWTLFWLHGEKIKTSFKVLAAFILGVGLSAFFTFPAFIEKNLVQTESLVRGDLNYLVHFVTAPQLFFDRTWGYGASFPGPTDTISFQIGWPHWWITFAMAILLIVYWKGMSKRSFYLGLILLIVFLGSIFMMHLRSNFIWGRIPLLQYAQFPWRFLSVTILIASLSGGLFISILKGNVRLWGGVIVVILTIILNIQYFKPAEIYPLTDKQKLSGKLWEEQQRASVLDYLPKTAVQPREPAQNKPLVLSGNAEVYSFENHSNRWIANLKVSKMAEIAVPVFNFPLWQIYIAGKEFPVETDNIGRIKVNLEPGEYIIYGSFAGTLIRTISNLITLISTFVLIILIIFNKRFRI